jgi:hypothetical protein
MVSKPDMIVCAPDAAATPLLEPELEPGELASPLPPPLVISPVELRPAEMVLGLVVLELVRLLLAVLLTLYMLLSAGQEG